MKKQPKSLFLFCLCLLGLLFFFSGLTSQQTAGELFEKALYLEEGQGDLKKAVEVYEKILAQYSGDREIAAKAQLHIGLCFEKLGLEEAQKAFQKVVDNYPDQSAAVKVAREKLSTLARARALVEKGREDLTIRQVWAGPEVDILGAVSPDGRHLSFVDWETGDLAIRDLASGTNRRLTNKGPWTNSPEFALFSKWSPDSRRIVYQWYNKDELFELRVIDVKDTTPRMVYKVGKKGEYVQPFDWSPDGRSILAGFYTAEAFTQLGLISVDEGSVKVLKTQFDTHLAAPKMWGFAFSPDGKYIAYDISQEEKAYEKKNIFLLSVDGSTETPLIEHPAIDTVIDWTPDGKGLLFISDRTGTQDVWLIRLAGGKPQGDAQLLKPGVGRIEPLGVTSRGELYYGLSGGTTDVYVVRIDPRTGKILAPPRKAVWQYEGHNAYPDYSPDGKLLAYISSPGMPTNRPRRALGILSLETGQIRELIPNLFAFNFPRWAPDGRTISVEGIDPGSRVGGIYRVDVQTAAVAPIVQFKKGMRVFSHRWSKDGKVIYYTLGDRDEKACSVFVHNLETGQDERLSGAPENAHDIDISPDGKWLVLMNREGKRAIRIMPASGGEPREIFSFEQVGSQIMTPAWSADGRYIFFSKMQKTPGPMMDLYRVSIDRGEAQKIDVAMGRIRHFSVHPDGQSIAFSSMGTNPEQSQVWVMENFLPGKERSK